MKQYQEPTVVIFGDTGGHDEQLFSSLHELGVDTMTGYIPDNLTIVHVGDLIHKGAHADNILEFLDKVFAHPEYAQQWVQLIGNHEAAHLGLTEGSFVRALCNCSPYAFDRLEAWLDEGHLKFATAVTNADPVFDSKEILLTHAGVTYPVWEGLGKPDSAQEVVQAIQEATRDAVTTKPNILWDSGMILGSTHPNTRAGIFWAEAIQELCESWFNADVALPFHQMHGHTHPIFWELYPHRPVTWWQNVPPYWRAALIINEKDRTYTWVPSKNNSGKIIGVDPSFTEHTPFIKQQPYVVVHKASIVTSEGSGK